MGNPFGGSGMWWEYQGTVRSCLLTKVDVSSSSCLWSLDLSIWASLQGGDSTEASQPAALRNRVPQGLRRVALWPSTSQTLHLAAKALLVVVYSLSRVRPSSSLERRALKVLPQDSQSHWHRMSNEWLPQPPKSYFLDSSLL